MTPKADNPRLDPNFLRDRPGAAPIRRQQNYPRPLQIALQRHRYADQGLEGLQDVGLFENCSTALCSFHDQIKEN
jgi:hypothetical protein